MTLEEYPFVTYKHTDIHLFGPLVEGKLRDAFNFQHGFKIINFVICSKCTKFYFKSLEKL